MDDPALEKLRARWENALKGMTLANYSFGGNAVRRRTAERLLNLYFRTLEREIETTDRDFEAID